jgi:coenzyme PQQ biosynthesis protein PqqD
MAQTHCGSRRRRRDQRNGGILRWIKLAEATGLDRERVIRVEGILPATRFIGNEYLNLVRTRPFLECVASSLTELFSRDLIALRMEKMRQHYPWLSSALDYFEARLTEAPEDAAFAIQYVFDHAATRAEQERVIQALRDKCDILWAQLDALYFAYVEPGWPPPGAFRIDARRRRSVAELTDASIPKFAAGCRWGGTTEAPVVLFPEGAIRVEGTGRIILELCDGHFSLAEIVQKLEEQFMLAPKGKIRADVLVFSSNCTPSASSIIKTTIETRSKIELSS